MATVLYQSSQTNSTGSGSSIALTKPVSLAAGDLLVAVIANVSGAGNAAISAPAGWVSLGAANVGFTYFDAFYKVADSADAAASSFTFPFAASATNAAGGVARFTGNSSSPVDGTATANASSTSGYTPSQSMGTTLILAAGWNGGGNTGSFASYAVGTDNPTWAEAFDLGTGTQKVGVAMAYAGRSGISATGTAQYTATDYNTLKIWVLNLAPGPIAPLALTSSVNPPASIRLGPFAPFALNAALNEPAFTEIAPDWLNTGKNAADWANISKS